MKNNILKCTALLLISLSSAALADQTYVCTHGQQERVISVVYENQANKVPCKVTYKKEGQTSTLWNSMYQEGFCEEKAEGFVQKQINWGWKCGDATPGETAAQSLLTLILS